MRAVILLFVAALCVTGFSTPWVRQAALALGFVDIPSARKVHRSPMPLLGGVAIFGGAIVVLAAYFGWREEWRVLGVLLAALVITIVGLIDDRLPLPAWLKFSGQVLAFLLVLALGTRVQLPLPTAVNIALTLLWFGAITNAVNFLDNMDGLCAGVSAVAAAFISLLAVLSDQYLIAPMAAAVFGACLGFLRYNFQPARIFMGDTGSLLLGFMLAYMTLQLRFPANSPFVTWMAPLLLMGVPLFDLALVTVSRLRRGVNPLTTAGKDHLSHRLTRLGYTAREAVLLIYLLGCGFGWSAVFFTRASPAEGYAFAAVVAALSLLAIGWLERDGAKDGKRGRE